MLSNKVVLVTGGGHGIGEAVAIELGKYGATVVVNDLGTSPEGVGKSTEPAETTVAQIIDNGGRATPHFGDVSDLGYTSQLVSDIVNEHGRLDGVVNFAGIVRNAPITEISQKQWDDVIRVHLGGHFALLQAASNHWEQVEFEKERSFIAVSSGAAHGGHHQLNYATAKAGILGFVRSASDELRGSGIRVNALLPGAKSRQNSHFPSGETETTPPEPKHVAPTVGFLFSDAAAGVNGLSIRAAGELIGLVSDPQATRVAYREGGWTIDSVADRFKTTFAEHESLDRSRY